MKIKERFLIRNIAIFLLPNLISIIILGSFSIFITQEFIRNDINNETVLKLNQAQEHIESVFGELDSLSLHFNQAFVAKIKAALRNESYVYDGILALSDVRSLLNYPISQKPYIHSIYLYFNDCNGYFVSSGQGKTNIDYDPDKSWLPSVISHAGEINTWFEVRNIEEPAYPGKETALVTVFKRLYTADLELSDGLLIVNFYKDYLDNKLGHFALYPEQSLLILNKTDILASNHGLDIHHFDLFEMYRNSAVFSEYGQEAYTYMVTNIRSGKYPLKYISVIPKRVLYQLPEQLFFFIISLAVLSFSTGLIFIYYTTRKNYNRIQSILSLFEAVKGSDSFPDIPHKVKDEYDYLLKNIIKTFIEKSTLKAKLSENKYKLFTAEMTALQSQINPHFLFNTLKTIFWKSISLTGDHNEVSKMIEYLSDILHYSLQTSDVTVTLEQEIRNTLSYIEIQKVRYKDKFGVIWQYDDAIAQYKVIKLLFQPIIENSIYHGIKGKEGKSSIKIKAVLHPLHLKITVVDNGLGMDANKLAKLKEQLSQGIVPNNHIGLYNISKRLQLLYGEKNSIEIRSKPGRGTAVYIVIPVA